VRERTPFTCLRKSPVAEPGGYGNERSWFHKGLELHISASLSVPCSME